MIITMFIFIIIFIAAVLLPYLSSSSLSDTEDLHILPHNSKPTRFEVFTEMLLKIQVFWDVTPCQMGSSYRRFEASFYYIFHGHAAQEEVTYYGLLTLTVKGLQ